MPIADLLLLKQADFDWTAPIDSVWREAPYHVDGLHENSLKFLLEKLEVTSQQENPANPLGTILIGRAGAGKTHLLGALRRECQNRGHSFIMADMTAVGDNFHETVLLGIVNSLLHRGRKEVPEFRWLLNFLLRTKLNNILPEAEQHGGRLVPILSKQSHGAITAFTRRVLEAMAKALNSKQEVLDHQDVVRALLLLNVDDFEINSVGYSWLQGLAIEDEEQRRFGFRTPQKPHAEIIRGLSWLMSLRGPVLLALDQLDALVAQFHVVGGDAIDEMNEAQHAALRIIEGVAKGLSDLWDLTRRTVIVVSCQDATIEILRQNALQANLDRYATTTLGVLPGGDLARTMVEKRLHPAYATGSFTPPYPSWPFHQQAFQNMGISPRELLKRCDAHRNLCLTQGHFIELMNFNMEEEIEQAGQHELDSSLDQQFQKLREKVKSQVPDILVDEQNEGRLAGILQQAGCWLVQEWHAPQDESLWADVDFPGGQDNPSLHLRMRRVFEAEGDREENFCFRVLQKSHATAFQARLRAAMTASGIDRRLSFRHLCLLRVNPVPSGPKTREMVQQFKDGGGVFVAPTEEDVGVLLALKLMQHAAGAEFDNWLEQRRPVSALPLFAPSGLLAALGIEPVDSAAGDQDLGSGHAPGEGQKEEVRQSPGVKTTAGDNQKMLRGAPGQIGKGPNPDIPSMLPLGRRLVGDTERETISIDPLQLVKHTVILAGTGSGKTVLVRRLVEEAALRGIPAIILDPANDLARFGQPWPEPPDGWSAEELALAGRLQESTQSCVWTPGLEKGNPLTLSPLPDLAAVAEDADELEGAVAMVRESLRGLVAPSNSESNRHRMGVLAAALRYFARTGGGGLAELVALLSDLPSEAGGGIGTAATHARKMADSLRAAMQTDPLLRGQGRPLDPALLFGLGEARTRISVINFSGLPVLNSQRRFINQLAMTLFTWIKRHPATQERPITGLLVIDEAKDFIPSNGDSECRESLLRLAAQARKYGLGMILATQEPKSIDHRVIANCSTLFFGQVNSPASIDVVRDQLRQRGGDGRDVARLGTGRFYVHAELLDGERPAAPVRIATPLCLFHHPRNPLTEEEVVRLAAASRVPG